MKVLIAGANPDTDNIGNVIALAAQANGHDVKAWSRSKEAVSLRYLVRKAQPDAMVVSVGGLSTVPIILRADARTHMDVVDNLVTPARLVEEFAQWDADNPIEERRKIVLLGSQAHRKVLTGMSGYCAAKAGLDMYARCAAWELRESIDVFIVHPANVAGTPVAKAIIDDLVEARGMTRQEAEEHWRGTVKRTITTPELASLVLNLIEDESWSWASGNPIDLTGGER